MVLASEHYAAPLDAARDHPAGEIQARRSAQSLTANSVS